MNTVQTYDLYLARRYCAFLDRIMNARIFNLVSETAIISRFRTIKSVYELKLLCEDISEFLIDRLGYKDFFIP